MISGLSHEIWGFIALSILGKKVLTINKIILTLIFFIAVDNNIIVVEIKSDNDDSSENKGKYKYGKQHFENLNEVLRQQNINQKYFFHFLSPDSYPEFEKYLSDGRLFSKGAFRSNLEDLLDPDEKIEKVSQDMPR